MDIEVARYSTCPEDGCSVTFQGPLQLRNHLALKHAFVYNVEKKSFSSFQDFTVWKDTQEKEAVVSFVQHCGIKRPQDATVTYFYCHRSGSSVSTSVGKRQARTSSKVGVCCTASMIVTVDNVSGVVALEYCDTHYGHTHDLKFARLTQSEKEMIAGMLTGKLSADVIL